MLLTKKQMKHLVLDDDGFRFVADGTVTNEERQMLLDLDASYFEVYNQHVITNLCELEIQ